MSKPMKNLITESYRRRFADVDGGVVIDVRGIKSNDNNRMRHDLANEGIRVTVVKNSLAKRIFADTTLAGFDQILDGPSAIVYGGDSVVQIARKLIDMAKQIEQLTFKGALMEGVIFGPAEVEALSKYPTREEAQAKVVQIFLSPARNVAGAINSPAANIAGILKTLQEKLEKGEAIAKAG